MVGTTVTISLDRFEVNKYRKMIADLELLRGQVSNYYLKYEALPLLRDSQTNNPIQYTYTQIDASTYYILDLSAMPGITLNYGMEGFNNPNTTDDVYVIEISNKEIYYVRGIELDGEIFHSLPETELINNSRLTSPKIEVIEGEKLETENNLQNVYDEQATIKFIPGIHKSATVTTYVKILKGEDDFDLSEQPNFESPSIPDSEEYGYNIDRFEDGLCYFDELGTYTIMITSVVGEETRTKEVQITISAENEPWVYNSATGEYERGDFSFAIGDILEYSDLEELGVTVGNKTYNGQWQIIGITNDNKLKLVSTENVGTCTLGFKDEVANSAKTTEEYNAMTDAEKVERGIASYQRAVQTLNEAAQTATGITSAESIDLQDIYDIIGENNVRKGTDYGKIYNYYYDASQGIICSKYSTDGGTTWSSPSTTSYTNETFVNANGEKIVVDSEGDEITLTYDYISYTLTADQKTAIGSLATGSYWSSAPSVYCTSSYACFSVRTMNSGGLYAYNLFYSNGNGYRVSMRSPCRSLYLKLNKIKVSKFYFTNFFVCILKKLCFFLVKYLKK